jgi:hypothetical protein
MEAGEGHHRSEPHDRLAAPEVRRLPGAGRHLARPGRLARGRGGGLGRLARASGPVCGAAANAKRPAPASSDRTAAGGRGDPGAFGAQTRCAAGPPASAAQATFEFAIARPIGLQFLRSSTSETLIRPSAGGRTANGNSARRRPPPGPQLEHRFAMRSAGAGGEADSGTRRACRRAYIPAGLAGRQAGRGLVQSPHDLIGVEGPWHET